LAPLHTIVLPLISVHNDSWNWGRSRISPILKKRIIWTNLDQQILDYFAEVVDSGDIAISQAMLDQWATDGKLRIISKMPKELLDAFVADSGDKTSNGYATKINYIRKVVRENGTDGEYVTCREIPAILAFDYANIAASDDPYFYTEAGAVYVAPDPGASPNAFKVFEVDISAVDVSAGSTISNFPSELIPYVVLYAVMQGKLREAAKMRRTGQDEFEALATDYGADSPVSTALTNARNILNNNIPSSGGDVYDVIDTDEDANRATALMNVVATEMKKAGIEMGTLDKDAANRMQRMAGYFKQAGSALQEYIAFSNQFETGIAEYVNT